MTEQISYKKVKNKYWYLLLFLSVSVILAWLAYSYIQPDYRLHVTYFDVGQGDAIFIQTYQGTKVLVDGGPDSSVLQKLGSAMPFFDRTIDLVILTHPHADHLAGLVEVLKRYRVKQILMSEITHSSETYKELKSVISAKNIKITRARAGMTVKLDKATSMQVLYPFNEEQGQLFQDLNETSVMTRLCFGVNCFLFTGDAPIEEEQKIISSGQTVSADVLKVGHHGSQKSSSEAFLALVNPKFAVITVGKKNKYGLPSQPVLNLLNSKLIPVIRTDEAGDIKFESDGRTLTIIK